MVPGHGVPLYQSLVRKLLELLRLTPEPHMREGDVMLLRNAVDDYVRAILHEVDAAVNDDGRESSPDP